MTQIAGWLTDNLPPETYPFVHWTVNNYDTARPMWVAFFVAYLAVIGLLGCGVMALLRRLQ